MLGAATFLALLVLPGCPAEAPPQGLEATCAKACEVQAPRCSSHECGRGCSLVLDRLAQSEGDTVIGCIARGRGVCDDRAWAACATRIGPHADGGPPPPPPPPDVTDEPGGD